MVIGIAWRETEQFPYFKKFVQNAKRKIKEFPSLHRIVGDFSGVNKENYQKNFILLLAAHAVPDPFFKRKPDLQSEKELNELEMLLKEIILTLGKDAKSKVKSRLKGFNENPMQIIHELRLYRELRQNDHVLDLDYENSEIGNHDFYFKLDGKEFNLELTGLGKGEIEKILERAFKEGAEEILEEIPQYTRLKFYIKTDMLLDEKGDNDSERIKKEILKHYSSIKPIIHIKRGIDNIEEIPDKPNKSLFDARETLKLFPHNYERILKLFKTDEAIKFLKKTKVSDINQNCISSFIISDAITELVEIDQECVGPATKAEGLRKQSMLRQLKKRIKCKIKEGQLKGKKNPIIAVNFQNVSMHNYSSDQEPFGYKHLKELKDIALDVLIKEKETEILGILFMENSINNSKFLQNLLIDYSDSLKKIGLLRN